VLGVLCAVSLGALWLWPSAPVSAQAFSSAVAAQSPVQPTQTSCHRVHIFKAGETFESIAEAELGDPAKWQQIRIANREWLDMSANGLEPGARLVVPVPCTS
jgi:nucleoid-associated protein YgaU